MTRYDYCPNCHAKAVHMKGETYDTKRKKHKKIHVGIYCMKCNTFEWKNTVPIKRVVGKIES